MYNVYIHGIPSNPPHTLFLSVYFPRFFLKLVLTCSGMYEEKGIQSGTFPRGKREGLAALNASHYKYNICQLLAKGNFKTLDNCMMTYFCCCHLEVGPELHTHAILGNSRLFLLERYAVPFLKSTNTSRWEKVKFLRLVLKVCRETLTFFSLSTPGLFYSR